MKTLSIQQPWASLICSGIKDVENRTWKAAKVPGRILIHASSKKVPKNFFNTIPLDWMIEIQNAIIYGNIPAFDSMPLSAIIGYATVEGFAENTESLWDGGEGNIKWQLKDMYLFDKPIENVKGQLNLFEYPIDEDNLPPAHKVELKYPELKGTELTLPCSEETIDSYKGGEKYVDIDFDLAMLGATTTEAGELKEIKTIQFKSPSRSLVCDAENVAIGDHLSPDTNQPIVEKNIFGEDIAWQIFCADVKNPR